MADSAGVTVKVTAAFTEFGKALSGLAASAAKTADAFQAFLPTMAPQATTTVWVQRTKEGELKAIPVVEMDTDHIWRWVQFFRRRYRENGFTGNNATLDALIQADMITGPAIYAEAVKRGIASKLGIDPDNVVSIDDGTVHDVVITPQLAQFRGTRVPELRKPRKPKPPDPRDEEGYRMINIEDD